MKTYLYIFALLTSALCLQSCEEKFQRSKVRLAHGRIVDARTKEPIVGANYEMYIIETDHDVFYPTDGAHIYSFTTQDDGTFKVFFIAAGDGTATIGSPGAPLYWSHYFNTKDIDLQVGTIEHVR